MTTKQKDPDELMTAKEVAPYLRCDLQTVYRRAKKGYFDGEHGRLLLVRYGGTLRFKRTDLEKS